MQRRAAIGFGPDPRFYFADMSGAIASLLRYLCSAVLERQLVNRAIAIYDQQLSLHVPTPDVLLCMQFHPTH